MPFKETIIIDIEAWRSEKFAFGIVYYPDRNGSYVVCNDAPAMWEEIISNVKKSKNEDKILILGHNIGYDLNWLVGNYEIFFVPAHVIEEGKNGPVKRYWKDLITRKGRFYKAKYYNLEFRDTFNLFPLGLKEAGKMVGLEKKIEKRKKFEDNSNGIITNDDIQYCLDDCRITHKLFLKIDDWVRSKNAKLGLTIASTSKNILFSMNPDFKKFVEYFFKHPYRAKLDDQFRPAYFGGRTECFRKNGKNLNYYDINSLYPFCMSDDQFNYPDPRTLKRYGGPIDHALKHYEGMAEIVIKCPDDIPIPVLPIRLKDVPEISDNKIIYPKGTICGSWLFPEIRLALEMGYEIIKVKSCIIGQRIKSPWTDFCRELYRERLAKKAVKDPTEILEKLHMNSGYGKFAMQNYEDRYLTRSDAESKYPESLFEIVEYQGQEYVKIQSDPERSRSTILCLSAYVTSHARTQIYNLYRKCDFDVYYSDTDSILTTKQIPTSDKMGDVKLEYEVKFASFMGRKDYLLILDGKAVIKRKGIPFNFMTAYNDKPVSEEIKRLYKEGNIQLLTELHLSGRITVNKIVKSREAIRRKIKASHTVIMTKERKTLYDTGKKWDKDYSYPFKIEQNELGKVLSIH